MDFLEILETSALVVIVIIILIVIVIIKLLEAIFIMRDELIEINSTLKTISKDLETTTKLLNKKHGKIEYQNELNSHNSTPQSAETTIFL